MFKFKALLEEISYPKSDVPPGFMEFIERVQELVGKQLEYKAKEYEEELMTHISFFYNSELVYSKFITVSLDSEKIIEELATKAADQIKERIDAMAFGQTEYDKMEMWVANVIPDVIKSLPKNRRLNVERDKKYFQWSLQGYPGRRNVVYTLASHDLEFIVDQFKIIDTKNIFKDFNGDPKLIANAMAEFFSNP